MYSVFLVSSSGFWIVGLIDAYGEETGPIMSKTFPITLRFSSTTVSPILGVFSAFIMMFRLGLICRTGPILCKIFNSPR